MTEAELKVKDFKDLNSELTSQMKSFTDQEQRLHQSLTKNDLLKTENDHIQKDLQRYKELHSKQLDEINDLQLQLTQCNKQLTDKI